MSEDNDKTVRIDDTSEEKTLRADQKIISSKRKQNFDEPDDSDATVRSDGDVIKASKDSDDEKTTLITESGLPTQPTLPSIPTNAPLAIKQDAFILNNKQYKVEKTISESTGEAQIYLIRNESGETAVLKLYYPNIKPKEALLKKLREIKHEDIIKVIDFGYYAGRFFELLEYAAGGTVDRYLPIRDMKKIKEIVAETANALEFCHKHGIIHRDIKPGNIFYKNADGSDILVGDFGISSLLDEDLSMQQTGQARTAIYAAPELYQSIGGQTLISKEIDYYSLGVTLMFIWLGENPFKGLDELSLMRLKNDGKIPIPESLPKELHTLVRGLTVVNKEKRWGADEIKRWLKGEDIEVWEEKVTLDYKPFYFDTDRNLIAGNPKELAALLLKDPQLGIRYLYRGKVSKWFEESKNQKFALEIDEIVEKIYPKDENAGLKLAAYVMDPDLPYEAVDGRKCSTLEEFADVFEDNFDEYKKRLQNKNDDFYLYLTSKGNKKQADKLRKLFKDYDPNLALTHAIYILNPDKPFKFIHPEDDEGNTYTLVNDPAEFSNLLLDYNEEGYKYLTNGSISAWLTYREEVNLAEWIDFIKSDFPEEDIYSALMLGCYVLDPDMGYVSEDKKTRCYEKEEFAWEIWNYFEEYKDMLKDQKSIIYMFFLSRRWDDVLDYAKYCFRKKDHKKKIGNYNVNIAVMKIIKLLGVTPEYEIDGQKFATPDDLVKADPSIRKKIVDSLSDGGSKLNAWISVFFHEDPFTKEGYEVKLKEYLDKLTEINPENAISKRFKEAAASVKKLIDKNRNIDSRFIYGWIASMAIPAIIAGLVIFFYMKLETNPLPGGFWKVSALYYIVITGIIVVFTFIGMKQEGNFDFSTGCIGGPIIGLVTAIILYYVIYFSFSYPIAFIVLTLALLGFFLYKLFRNTYTSNEVKAQLFNENDESVMVWEPLKFAFSKEETFTSSREEIFKDYVKQRRRAKYEIFKYSALGTITLAALLELMLYYNPKYYTISDMLEKLINSFK